MKYLLLVRPEAEQDIKIARDWYDGVQSGLSDAFLDEISAALHPLPNYPEISRLYYKNFRRILLHRFPYKIFYQVIGQRVVIFRVLHVRQCHESALSEVQSDGVVQSDGIRPRIVAEIRRKIPNLLQVAPLPANLAFNFPARFTTGKSNWCQNPLRNAGKWNSRNACSARREPSVAWLARRLQLGHESSLRSRLSELRNVVLQQSAA